MYSTGIWIEAMKFEQPHDMTKSYNSDRKRNLALGASVTAGHALSVAENRKLVAHASTRRSICVPFTFSC